MPGNRRLFANSLPFIVSLFSFLALICSLAPRYAMFTCSQFHFGPERKEFLETIQSVASISYSFHLQWCRNKLVRTSSISLSAHLRLREPFWHPLFSHIAPFFHSSTRLYSLYSRQAILCPSLFFFICHFFSGEGILTRSKGEKESRKVVENGAECFPSRG